MKNMILNQLRYK
jgi:hypothetical protein